MDAREYLNLFSNHPKLDDLRHSIAQKYKLIYANGLKGSAFATVFSSISSESDKTQLVILKDNEEAIHFFNDVENFFEKEVYYFPKSYKRNYDLSKTDNANVLYRSEALKALSEDQQKKIIITYPEALLENVASKKVLHQNTFKVKVGNNLGTEFVNETLHELGFKREDFVTEPGEYSIRGGIVDVFSFSNSNPFRIEFFGDEVDSIREFDPINQLSLKKHVEIVILPSIHEKLVLEERCSFFDLLPENTMVWLSDKKYILQSIYNEFETIKNSFSNIEESTIKQIGFENLYQSPVQIDESMNKFSSIDVNGNNIPTNAIEFSTTPHPFFNKNFDLLSSHLHEQSIKGYKNYIASDNEKQLERINLILKEKTIPTSFLPINFSINEGFIDHDLKISVCTEHRIFNRHKKSRLKEGYKKKEGFITLKELNNLNNGDFVVHIDHGIGQFAGLQKIDVNGKKQEAIKIVYKNHDILYVSVHSLHKISKYSNESGSVSVDKLGSGRWQKVKEKTKKRVKELAFDLIKLYAKRKAQKGFAFSPDSYMQNELEASFIYEDTPDQEKATKDVKADMEKPYPMDRLVCGDVGFGKTEVAIRAAFKAVTDGKQVAVLVPTTILALQHYKTFKDRLENLPVTVDFISRFKSVGKQKETLKALQEGKVDIIIGTHRLVSKDVKFKDLGLLVIDEEQKFGVSVKDKLKTFKVNVDTLTLTATPIPRTLQFSMMGARDFSVISTPPPNRQPVQTELHSFNEEVIRDAINYEVQRGGQVFFIHNRIQNIDEVAALIERLCPDARALVAHGQMKPQELEEKMYSFIEGEYDVLVCTTIVESGLDIPNANTIIINQAQNFGLSDLHQLRGRVGRSNKKAFCYLISPPFSTISEDSRKRLTALEQFSDLGSGFHIAMRDLDIRGAGDLLGADQSGFMSDIGYEMYQKILDEALQELKEQEYKELYTEESVDSPEFKIDCQIDTDLEILIPDEYIENIAERINIYKEIDNLSEENQLEKFKVQLIDRFGEIPKQVNELIELVRLRWKCEKLGIEKLMIKQSKLLAYFISNKESAFYSTKVFTETLKYFQHNPHYCVLKQKNDKLYFVIEDCESVEYASELLSPLYDNVIQEKLNKELITNNE